MTQLHGLVLAAGAGTRYGQPKALARDVEGAPWLELAVTLLRSVGCVDVTAVLGARAEEARELVPAGASVTVAANWRQGMSASLRAGLAAAALTEADAVLLTLVDLPGLPRSVAARILHAPVERVSLRQAVFEGRPGHPVLIGRDHWEGIGQSALGDRGARSYLRTHGVLELESSDLWNGSDVDRPTV
ncbi:MAG: hypothetical protein JWP75_442 [Frondihabitans sp.]|nr:hypothetical protein [Frondihabitans sp.]